MRNKKGRVQRVFNKMRLSNILKTKERQKEVQLRKNFLPTLIVIFLLWLSLAYIIFFIDPAQTGAVNLLFLLLFFTLLFTLSTLFANTRRGFIVSASTVFFLSLAYFGVANILNFILIIAIVAIIEIYLMKS